jgi:DNA-binding transcriptional ArsR family regulator
LSEENIKVLRDISKKLDQLIILMKLSNKATLEDVRKKIERDKIVLKILESADGSLSYSTMSKKISEDLGVAEITVKKKISELKELGILMSVRRGKEVYYESTGLLE